MDYRQVLGETIRDVRINLGLSRDAFSEITSRSYIREIEQGLTTIGIDMLVAISERLGISPSELMLIAEAKLAGEELKVHARMRMKQLSRRDKAGVLKPVSEKSVAQGLKGKRAEETQTRVERLQGTGLSKNEIAKTLGVSMRTVGRYWIEMDRSSEDR